MNFLFGLGIALISALFAYVLISVIAKAIPKALWDEMPDALPGILKGLKKPFIVLIFIVVFANNFGTYGPRLTLDAATHIPQPERTEIEVGKEWSEAEALNRFGNADEKLADEPVRAPITDAKDDEPGEPND